MLAEDEPPDLTALYEDETIPPAHRVERVRPDQWRFAPSREGEAGEASTAEDPAAEASLDPRRAARRRRRRLIVIASMAAVLLAAAIGFGWHWYATLRWLESTDDAYTQADNTVIAPKIAGYVSQVLATDNQAVKPGDPLLRIDPRDYQAALAQAEADIRSAEANIRNIDAQIAAQQSVVAQAQADIVSAQANLTFSQQEYVRYQELVRTGTGTVQRAQQAAADLREKQAALQHNQATLDQATKQIDVLKTQRGVAEAALLRNRAALQQANLNLGYTSISSPIEGVVGDRSVRVGQYVQPGTQLMTIVPMGARIYIVANYKETQIRRMFRGESVDVTIDTFPGVHLSGRVDSLAPGSGAQFALLPPENATGKLYEARPARAGEDRARSDQQPGAGATAAGAVGHRHCRYPNRASEWGADPGVARREMTARPGDEDGERRAPARRA
jgi:membrane fusion protein (multidrug efflux system)